MNPSAGFPSVSLLVLTYQQCELLDVAVQAAFAQDCPPIEIVLSDDGSTDGSFERLEALAAGYRGVHRVRLRPRGPNLGIAAHYNELLRFADGELLITAAGDDISAPDRVRRLVEAWDANDRRADLIASDLMDMDASGRLHDPIRVDDLGRWRGVADWMARRPYIVGAGHAFTRRLMERFGPMDARIAYEDQIMVFRAIALGGAITVAVPLVHYRRGGTSVMPGFESAEDQGHWSERQLDRLLAEMQQLVADAERCGHGEAMRALMSRPLKRDRYLRTLLAHPPWPQRWRAYRDAAPLGRGWRLRKLLHSAFPQATFRIKSVLQLFHRRYWRARHEARLKAQREAGRD
ncbi:glycosyltransferase [uncultured Methylibium sp.]|uniref:glycosyltransferase family 2 protein n=1 Tax=uncultured Methylibium sp. TaxID=381093 RepID=UPI0025E0B441|nr:glycosyltransferase [uncultured Methylibium sp.]